MTLITLAGEGARDVSWSGAFISILECKKISHWEGLAGGMKPEEERELSFFLCESLAGGFLLSMHAPKESGWMETGAAEGGRGFPAFAEIIAARLSMPPRPCWMPLMAPTMLFSA